MPTLEENKLAWDSTYPWIQQGEEWSWEWGGAEAQWYGSILPRIHAFIPAGTILEIAPGFGRWTHFLKASCDSLIGVDLGENCIRACRQRFAAERHLSFHVNDGKSLAMVADESIDFAFSFDSLVHAEADVIGAYLEQLARKLKPDGIGFIHHSNLGQYGPALARAAKIPRRLRRFLVDRPLLGPTHWRAPSMTAKQFEDRCDRAGLQCVGQELVNWGTDGLLIDCFSLFARRESSWSRPNRVIENPGFMKEAHATRMLAPLYAATGFEGRSPVQERRRTA